MNRQILNGRLWLDSVPHISCQSKQSQTLTGALIGQEFVSFLTAALETPHRVAAEMIAASVILQTLIDVCGIERKREMMMVIRQKHCTSILINSFLDL